MKSFTKTIAALALGAAVIMAVPAIAAPVWAPTPTARPDTTVRVIDGDTFMYGEERIRLQGPDAPELKKARCPQEKIIAVKAKERLQQLLGDNFFAIQIERRGFDKYGRTLALVFVAESQHDVGETLIAEALAVEWKPSRREWLKRARHWCPDFVERAE